MTLVGEGVRGRTGSGTARSRPRLDRVEILTIAAVVIGGAAVLFAALGQGSLLDWDEATYAEIAKEIHGLQTWVFPQWNGQPWLNKAPLYPWLTAAVYHVAGSGEVQARAVSAAAGVGTLLVTYLIGRRVYGRSVGLVAVVVLGSCYEFLAASRFGTSDGLLTLFLYLSVYAFIRAVDGESRWWYATGAFVGLAIMTKDFAALVAPLAFLVTLAVDRRVDLLRRRSLWMGALVALAVMLPWHLAQLVRYGGDFLRQYAGAMVVDRATNQIEGHTGNAFTYVALARNQFFPWIYAVPLAAVLFVVDRRRERSRSSVLLVLPLVVFGLYTLVASKLAWYILPIYPALALLVGNLLIRSLRSRAALAAVALSAVAAVVSVPHSLDPTPTAWVVALVAALAVGAAALRALRRPPAWAVVPAAAVFFLAVGWNHAAGLYRLPQQPVVRLAHVTASSTSGTHPVVLFLTGTNEDAAYNVSHSLIYYARRRVTLVESPASLRRVVACTPAVTVVTPVKDVTALGADYHVQRLARVSPYSLVRVTPKALAPRCQPAPARP